MYYIIKWILKNVFLSQFCRIVQNDVGMFTQTYVLKWILDVPMLFYIISNFYNSVFNLYKVIKYVCTKLLSSLRLRY